MDYVYGVDGGGLTQGLDSVGHHLVGDVIPSISETPNSEEYSVNPQASTAETQGHRGSCRREHKPHEGFTLCNTVLLFLS